MDDNKYDEWKLNCGISDTKIVACCEYCNAYLYSGEDAIVYEDNYFCPEECCLVDYLMTKRIEYKLIIL